MEKSKKLGIKHVPKKSLGQHFLTSPHVVRSMVKAARVTKGEIVLEIGPGKGILTRALLAGGAEVTAIEKDAMLLPYLEELFAKELEVGKLKLLEDDVMNFMREGVFLPTYKVVANIPYYLTGAIFKIFLSAATQPQSMTLLVQKEVADRIIARDNKESILSISVKAYGDPHYIETVSGRLFKPQPKVDSAILSIENISRDNFIAVDETLFFKLVTTGFSHKRKLLIKNLTQLYTLEQLKSIFEALELSQKIRAEDLSVETWFALAKRL